MNSFQRIVVLKQVTGDDDCPVIYNTRERVIARRTNAVAIPVANAT